MALVPKAPRALVDHLRQRIVALNAAHARGELSDAVHSADVARLTAELREVSARINALPRIVLCRRCDETCSYDGGPDQCWGKVTEGAGDERDIHMCEGHAPDGAYKIPASKLVD